VFRRTSISRNSYPNHLGHEQAPGSFRCHDNQQGSTSGEKINKNCDTCHAVVAEDEKDPAVLKQLQ